MLVEQQQIKFSEYSSLYDLIVRGKLAPHEINKGDVLILASVGAGMNINAIIYQH